MAAFLIVVGLLGYGVSALVHATAPSITQEIAGLLIATNATLFFIGGIIVARIDWANAALTSRPAAPAETA